MRVIFIGGGNMAEAIFSRLDNYNIVVIQRNLQKIEKLRAKYPMIDFLPVLDFTTTAEDLIFLSVKPQDAKVTCQGIRQYTKNSTIISVMAGITCQSLNFWLDNQSICRTIPNTPSMLGFGVAAIYFTPAITRQHVILDIFAKLGKVYHFSNEDQIDQMTAVASSGIGYVFYYIEVLVKTAVEKFNFSPELAKDVILQVVKGSMAMIENNPDVSIEELRKNVTSKKGTTEQAIRVFEQYNLYKIVSEAELACYNRAKELSQLFADH